MDKNRIIKIWNTLKSWLIYGGKFIVYIAKFVVWESKKIIVKYPKYVAIAGGVVVLVVATALSVPPILKWLNRPRPLPLTTAPASSGYQFAAADKKTQFSVLIGESGNNTPKIQATFGNVSVDFVLTDLNQNISKPSKTTNKVVFKDVRPNVDLSYQTLTNGIKEEIIVKAPSEGNAFTFTLNNFGAAPRKIAPQTYGTVFYDTKGTYAFHFSKPFAVDATGARTDNVLLSIHKADTDPSYKATVIVNKKWLADPARAYPISIDPTIVYDTTAEFAAGQMNRVTDTQPATGDGTGGTITYSGGYTIHTFTSSGTFTPPSAMNVETLVVAGGGGGGQDYGGGGGGGGVIYNPSFAVTAQAYPITVGNGMATETQGQNSVFSSLTAVGGGAGGRWGNGGNGGSGGGAGYLVASGGTATSGQGSNGGSTVSQVNYRGSGGGGGSQVGYASNHATYPGQGGAGYTSSISGTSQVYAGGGGAAGSAGSGAGGSGGGGNAPGGSGTANTGGGGASCAGVGCTAGSGGSGIVIIRYPTTNSPNLTTNYQELATDINTIGFYHFGNGACATDSSGNAYTLTANGGMTCATGGMFGYKASGFTTGPVSYSHTTILDRALPSGTIEAWINPANLSAVQTILYADSTSDTLLTLGTSGQINFSTSASTNLATANAVVPISTWTHVAATWTSAGHKIYINGVETASDTNTTTHTSQDYTTYVGVGSGGNTLPFSGSIDELRMSNIARTPEEIKLDASRRPYSVYTSDVIDLTTVSGWNSLTWTELGVTTGDGETLKDNTSLVAQWNFNETSGTAADNAETTADRDLTLNNFASTASQDQAAGTGWTANNKKWGAGALMLSSVATADTLSAANPGSNGLDPNSADMTIEMWVKTNDVTAELLSNNSANGTACTSNGYYLGIDASGYPVFYLDTNGATAGCDAQISTPTTKIHDGKWHFLAVSVTRGTSAIMYLDGVNIGSDTSVTSYSAITVAGNVLVGSTNAFDGVIDSTRVYSRALSQNEIMSNYQAGNVELQTRVGSSTDANDGTWEAWKPTTGEAALASMDSDAANWTWDSSATYMPQAKSNESTIKVEGSGSLKQILGQPQVDANTMGLWHLDETGGSGAYLKNSDYTAPTINTGTGSDGACIMDNGTKILDTTAGSSVCNGSGRSTAYAVNFSDTTLESAGETSVTVSSTPTGFAVGDEFIIINLRGTSGDFENVGKYETHIISSISTNTLNFTDSVLANTYDGTTQKIMVQRVPNFGDVTICGGNTGGGCTAAATLTATAWDGTKNGVLFFRSNGTVTVNSGGTITASALGYRGGGNGAGSRPSTGYQGESYKGTGSMNTGANAGGGGGGDSGASGDGGGGGGGYATAGGGGGSLNGGSGGAAGGTYGSASLSTLFLGSGGGNWSLSAAAGSNPAGGIVYVSGSSITVSGTISANGGTCNSESGGCASGGSVYLAGVTVTLGSGLVTASASTPSPAANPTNGGGGSGRIAVYYTSSVSGTTTPTYSTTAITHGTPTGTTVINGASGKARLFDDVDDIGTIPDSSELDLSTNGTIEAWIKTNANEANNWFLCKSGNYCLGVNATGAFLFTGASAQDNAGTSLLAGTWHHVAVTNNNTTATYYVDGAAAGTDAVAWGTTLTNSLIFGSDGGSNFFDGDIDEVRISNSVRSAEEIAESYRAGRDHYLNKTISSTDLSAKTSLPFYIAADRQGTYLSATLGESAFVNYQPDANTVGLWHLDEQSGSGAYIKDSASTNHGTPTGTTYTQGKIGKARYFNGSSDKITSSLVSNAVSSVSLSAWFSTTSYSADRQPIVYNGTSGGTNGYGIFINQESEATGQIKILYGAVAWYATGKYITNSDWHHVVLNIMSDKHPEVYLDGQLIYVGGVNNPVTPTANTYIGTDNSGTGTPFFTGIIDEVSISNTNRTADQIRQAYEMGLRTHPITIDFKANLAAGNLIASCASTSACTDKSFTVDETAFGSSAAANHIFLGDKIIIKENYNGTEYLTQGTVNAVNSSTGAVTVASWDTGSSFPDQGGGTYGYTANATVFKWQREYFDLRGSLSTQRDAITNLTLRETDGSQGATVWLDDFRSSGGYLTTPAGSTITSSSGNQYFQYRMIETSFDTNVSTSVTSATIDYVLNVPCAPTIGTPTNMTASAIQWNFTGGCQGSSAIIGFKVYDGSNTLVKTCDGAAITSCTETGLSTNTQYTRKVVAYNSYGNSGYSATATTYTLAVVPGTPATSGATATTVGVNPDPSTNPAGTQLALYKETGTACDGSGGSYVAANGSDNGATAVWQTDAQWATVTVTGLNLETNFYSFCLKARNGDNTETVFGSTVSDNGGYIPLAASTFTVSQNISTGIKRYVDGANASRWVWGLDSGTGNNTSVLTMSKGTLTMLANTTLVAGSVVFPNGPVVEGVDTQIIMNTGGVSGSQMKLGSDMHLWTVDADADGYPSVQKLWYGTTGPANSRRLKDMTTMNAVDCDDSVYKLDNVCCTGSGGACTADIDCCAGVPACGTDADADGYFSSTLMHSGTCQTSKPYTDCNDSGTNAGHVWVSATCYVDGDNDDVGSVTSKTCMDNATCGNATWGSNAEGSTASNTTFSSSNNDCDDGNGSRYPGNTSCYCDGNDHDCAGETKCVTVYACGNCTTNPGGQAGKKNTAVPGIASGTACGAQGNWWVSTGQGDAYGCFAGTTCPAQTSGTACQTCR